MRTAEEEEEEEEEEEKEVRFLIVIGFLARLIELTSALISFYFIFFKSSIFPHRT